MKQNREVKVEDLTSSPTCGKPLVMGSTGKLFNVETTYNRVNTADVVFTPESVAKMIVEYYNPTGKCLDPCKGEGAFLKYMPIGSDWCEIAYKKSFFDYHKKVDWIISNPPYSIINEWLEHSFKIADNIVYLLPINKTFSSWDRMKKIKEFGGIKEMWFLGPGNRVGFPFGFLYGCIYLKKGYVGPIEVKW